MKQMRYTEEQIAYALRQAKAGTPHVKKWDEAQPT